jgi:hypothetical protein
LGLRFFLASMFWIAAKWRLLALGLLMLAGAALGAER